MTNSGGNPFYGNLDPDQVRRAVQGSESLKHSRNHASPNLRAPKRPSLFRRLKSRLSRRR